MCSFAIFYGDTGEEKDYIMCEERVMLAVTQKSSSTFSTIPLLF